MEHTRNFLVSLDGHAMNCRKAKYLYDFCCCYRRSLCCSGVALNTLVLPLLMGLFYQYWIVDE
jgi:hypothetical protein